MVARRAALNLLGLLLPALVVHCGGMVSPDVEAGVPSSDPPPVEPPSPCTTSGDSMPRAAGAADNARSNHGQSGRKAPREIGPLRSCKALLALDPSVPSGFYFVTGDSGEEHFTFCDMQSEGGGWTRISYPEESDVWIAGLIRGHARQLLKCAEEASEYVSSPVFTAWSWSSCTPTLVPGDWVVNGRAIGCGKNPHVPTQGCASPYGVGCSDGSDTANNLLPGFSPAADSACGHGGTVYATGAFAICTKTPGQDSRWVTFLREEG